MLRPVLQAGEGYHPGMRAGMRAGMLPEAGMLCTGLLCTSSMQAESRLQLPDDPVLPARGMLPSGSVLRSVAGGLVPVI